MSSPVGAKVDTDDAVTAGGAVDAVIDATVVESSTVAAVGLGPGPPPHPGTAQGQLQTSQVE